MLYTVSLHGPVKNKCSGIARLGKSIFATFFEGITGYPLYLISKPDFKKPFLLVKNNTFFFTHSTLIYPILENCVCCYI